LLGGGLSDSPLQVERRVIEGREKTPGEKKDGSDKGGKERKRRER
jgi:hypothetical protein